MKRPYPCRRCVAESLVEITGEGYKVQCTVKPKEHQVGPFKSREKAIRLWNELQAADGDG